MRPFVERLVETSESSVVLTEPGMDERAPVGRYELAARQLFQLSEYLLSFAGATGRRCDEASRRNRNRPLAEHFLNLSKF
jgi:hypothetical protein